MLLNQFLWMQRIRNYNWTCHRSHRTWSNHTQPVITHWGGKSSVSVVIRLDRRSRILNCDHLRSWTCWTVCNWDEHFQVRPCWPCGRDRAVQNDNVRAQSRAEMWNENAPGVCYGEALSVEKLTSSNISIPKKDSYNYIIYIIGRFCVSWKMITLPNGTF